MSTDRGYTLLLNHLHNPGTTVPLSTIQGALSHHLAKLEPSPTPLAATAISSPFYISQPIDYAKLYSLSTALRHASHLKFRALVQEERTRTRLQGLFKQSALAAMDAWAADVVRGLQGGHPVLRLACCSGLLLGIEDIRHPTKDLGEGLEITHARGAVEDEEIVALAEVMDAYAYAGVNGSSTSSSSPSTATNISLEEWEKEFQPAGQDLLSLTLIFASQSFPLISQNKLKVLPLPILVQILTSTITATFKHGTFLSSVSASVTLSPEHQVHISPSSAFAQTLYSISTSPLTAAISSISKFTSNVLSLVVEEDLGVALQSLNSLRDVAKSVERDWISTSLASVSDDGVAPDSKEMAKSVWTILKTLLFTVLMVADGALSAVVFLPLSRSPSATTPSSLALVTLNTLSHLSFAISQFGGVTSTGNGFEALKKTFYLSLDILAQDGDGKEAEEFVRVSCVGVNSQRIEGNAMFRQAKQAFTLASIEQLVPVISGNYIRDWIWGVCYPHLNDPSNRETFESAHSVILTIFASHAAQQQLQRGRAVNSGGDGCDPSSLSDSTAFSWFSKGTKLTKLRSGRRQLRGDTTGQGSPSSATSMPQANAEMNSAVDSSNEGAVDVVRARGLSTDLVQHMVPFYARCLIENSAEGRLSTPQLRMAYAALVRSACACTSTTETWSSSSPSSFIWPLRYGHDNRSATSLDARNSTQDDNGVARYALGWYCVRMLLDTLSEIAKSRDSNGVLEAESQGKAKGKAKETQELQNVQQVREGEDTSLERVHRLNLTLVSTISSLPLVLLAKVLPEVYAIVVTGRPLDPLTGNMPPHDLQEIKPRNKDQEDKRKELVEELFEEILEGVGDREKEYAMRWWHENRESLIGPGSYVVPSGMGEKEGEKGEHARL